MSTTTRFPADTIAELELLSRFELESMQQGLKIHQDAPVDVLGAAERLFNKGMISQQDGGYLTDRGIEAAEALQRVLRSLDI
jgi:uncharacterized protein (TIGR02647 family)